MKTVRLLTTGAMGFMLGASLMMSPKSAKWRKTMLREADTLRKSMMGK